MVIKPVSGLLPVLYATPQHWTKTHKHLLTSGFCLQWERVRSAFISRLCGSHRCSPAQTCVGIDGKHDTRVETHVLNNIQDIKKKESPQHSCRPPRYFTPISCRFVSSRYTRLKKCQTHLLLAALLV